MIHFFKQFLWLIVILSLAACNLPGQAPEPTSTDTQAPPTPTQEPSATPLPPSETPTEAPTPSWTVPPPPIKPTATFTPISTKGVQPKPGAKFVATFDGGSLVFVIGEKGTLVTPRQARLRKASCRGGGTISESLTFSPPQYYPIQNSQFYFTWDKGTTITGIFTTPLDARGTIEITITKNDKTCHFGPVNWVATVSS